MIAAIGMAMERNAAAFTIVTTRSARVLQAPWAWLAHGALLSTFEV
jgi:hypothetical protein